MAVQTPTCRHEEWSAHATVIRETETEGGPVTGWRVDFEMLCIGCLTQMQWLAVAAAAPSTWMPTSNATSTEISLPCRPFAVEVT